MLFRRKPKIDYSRMPQHVAFIMDGNGRWAKSRAMPRAYGHKVGVDSVVAIIKHAQKLGIKYISMFAFSTENWKRPKEEIDEIFRLVRTNLTDKKEDFIKNNYKLHHMGDISKLPKDLEKEILECEEKTKENTGLVVNFALNYGSRAEIVNAVNKIVKNGQQVTEDSFKEYLYTYDMPDPDLVIRTSGEYRLSNFMLYQLAYSELYFPKVHWPAFREKELEQAIIEFQSRNRRFGKTQEQIETNRKDKK